MSDVVVFDYGSGNTHSVVKALEHVGARVTLTAERAAASTAAGLFVPGVGNFHACMAGLLAAGGPDLIAARVAAGRPVLGVCVGMQIMFDSSTEPSVNPLSGLRYWSGVVEQLRAPVVPHMGWSTVDPPADSALFAGVEQERFYFVHSYAVQRLASPDQSLRVTWSEHGGVFAAAVEDGALCATQFHPEKSGDAGLHLLRNWVQSLT